MDIYIRINYGSTEHDIIVLIKAFPSLNEYFLSYNKMRENSICKENHGNLITF